jgi:hypothetical protein
MHKDRRDEDEENDPFYKFYNPETDSEGNVMFHRIKHSNKFDDHDDKRFKAKDVDALKKALLRKNRHKRAEGGSLFGPTKKG